MKFEDLQFHPHESVEDGIEAKAFFPNGFGAQVEGGPEFKGDGISTFEVTVLQGTDENHDICLLNDICDVSVPHATKDVVEEVLNDIATLIHETDPDPNQRA